MQLNSVLMSVVVALTMHHVSCQSEISSVASLLSNAKQSTSNCFLAKINDNHGVTTARCANAFSGQEGIEKVHIHPNYSNSQSRINNIGVVRFARNSDTNALTAIPLGGIISNSSCVLNLFAATVNVYSPQFCDSAFNQAYCSLLTSAFACGSELATPLFCGGLQNIDGILISENGCDANGTLYYHSMSDFKAWINEVSGAPVAVQVSIVTIFSVFVTLINFL